MNHSLDRCNDSKLLGTSSLPSWGLLGIALVFAPAAFAADAIAGKQKVQQECASCHQPNDWEGETEASLSSLMKDIVAGKVSHHKKQLTLSDQEIENIAAYWARNNKK
jgi:mono/diheme cytochrome c family protein